MLHDVRNKMRTIQKGQAMNAVDADHARGLEEHLRNLGVIT